MPDNNFVVKNGLVVNTNVLFVNAISKSIGVNTASPNATLSVVGTANISANVVIGGTLNVPLIDLGVSSINATIYSATANNANNLNGNPQAYYTNATNLIAGTVNAARLPAANTTVQGAVIIIDSVVNTSIIIAPSANSVKNAYDRAIDANTRAATAQTAAIAAYANGVAYTDIESAIAYTNAITIAANATNLTSGTVNVARLPDANSTVQGVVQIIDSVVNTSILIAPSANSVKNAYDRAIDANTRAFTAQTAATAAYSNAIAIAANATNLTSGTVNNARLPVVATTITQVGTLTQLSATGNVTLTNVLLTSNATANVLSLSNSNLNVDSGVLFVDAVNNRVGINNSAPDASLLVTGAANVSGRLWVGANIVADSSVTVAGDLYISGNLTYVGSSIANGDFIPFANGLNLGNTTNRWDLFGVDLNIANNITTGNVVANTTSIRIGNTTVYTYVDTTKIEGTGTFSWLGMVAAPLMIGNSTVNNSINGTSYSGVANNSLNLGGQLPAYYNNATNLNAGIAPAARLPAANTTVQGAVIIIDSVANTSISIAPSANSVKNAYDRGIDANTRAFTAQTAATAAYTNAIAIASNATNLTSGTVNPARLPDANSTVQGVVQIIDSVVNTSISIAASANSVKNAYDRGATAYTNAITIAANATNITSGTVNNARLPAVATTITSVGTLTGLTVSGSGTINNTLTVGNTSINALSGIAEVSNIRVTEGPFPQVRIGSYDRFNANQGFGVGSQIELEGGNPDALSWRISTRRDEAVTALRFLNMVVGNATVSLGNNSLDALTIFPGNSTAYAHIQTPKVIIQNTATIGTLLTIAGITTINSTIFSATANNSLNLGGQLPAYYTNATNIITGTLDDLRLPAANGTNQGAVIIIDSVVNTSISIAASANSVKNVYDRAIDANTRAATAQTAATAAYTNAIAIASNATNLTSGTVNPARLPDANSTVQGVVQIIDSVVNTSISIAASANSVKNAYDRGATAYTNAITIAANATNLTSGIINVARLPDANSTVQGVVQIIDSVVNTSILIAPSANSVKNAYDRGIDANTRAFTAQTAATAAYSNAVAQISTTVTGKKAIWIDASAMRPKVNNGAGVSDYDSGTNDLTLRCIDFDTTTQEYVHFKLAMPDIWNEGTITFKPYWTNTLGLTTETVVFSLSGVSFSNDDGINLTAFGIVQTSTDTWLAQNDLHVGPESAAITIAGTPQPGDLVVFEISRVVASDNLTGDARLVGIMLYLTTNSINEP